MATHGRTRQMVIASLENKKAFKTSGSFSAVEGSVASAGRMPTEVARLYNTLANMGSVAYTVLSYATPIAYVTTEGEVVVPDVKYSQTTTQQQHLCRAYLGS